MKKIWKLSYLIPAFWLYRSFGWPRLLPINYTLSLTTRCNSRCKTCKIWKHKLEDELTVEEWKKVIESLGNWPFWITLSGGEVFLLDGLKEIILSIARYNQPLLLVIPTNGLLVDRIVSTLEEVLSEELVNRGIGTITLNVSLDGVGELHDEIRGIPRNFDKVLDLVGRIKELKQRGNEKLVLGIHTVLSKWNVDKVEEISEFVWREIQPDHHIFEIAEVRSEMHNLDCPPTPSLEDYKRFLSFWFSDSQIRQKRLNLKGVSRITDKFRRRYYKYLGSVVYAGGGKEMPSYAGFATVHINANGDVWDCAVFCNKMGNVRDYSLNFKEMWFDSPEVKEIQRKVKSGHRCPLANENYINLLMSPWELLR